MSFSNHVIDTEPCGSEPARDEAGTFNIDVARCAAIASKPAPTEGQIIDVKKQISPVINDGTLA